ncbi:MAG: putative NEK protein kinase [Streblomastix strix]|uniref:Putative NEK protein kinase n=1 Tax=Streblomastix strix TaxID=222440 RepID=A0A5J4WPM0_9EUKA|nr:MAG: putative NEK protein kinase [Streblomastix strix]
MTQDLKFVIVGDCDIGKTTLLNVYSNGAISENYYTSVLNNYIANEMYNEKSISMSLNDAPSQVELSSIRPLLYENADLYFICYYIDNQQSLLSIRSQWVPEIYSFCKQHGEPKPQFVVIGLKDYQHRDDDFQPNNVLDGQAETIAKEIGARGHIVCSLLNYGEVQKVFKLGIRICLDKKMKNFISITFNQDNQELIEEYDYNQGELYQALTGIVEKKGGDQSISISKGDIVKVINKGLLSLTIEKDGKTGKVPKGKLRTLYPGHIVYQQSMKHSQPVQQTKTETSISQEQIHSTEQQQIIHDTSIPKRPPPPIPKQRVIPPNSGKSEDKDIEINIPFNTSWKISDFEQKERLGKGGFGIVRHVIEKSTQSHMAWKEMDYEEEKEKEMVNKEKDQTLNICRIITKATSSSFLHVVQPLGFFISDDERKAYLVMEFCAGGDLRKYINNMKKSGMEISPQKAYQMIGYIAISLIQLHASGIIHSDLKPENVLLTEDFKVKLADFGLSRQLQVGREYTTNHGGTFLYQGPEILRNKSKAQVGEENSIPQKIIQTTYADIWAFGVMMFELLAQRHPFFNDKTEGDISAEEFIHRVVDLPPAELPDHYPLKLKNLIKQMLVKDPSQRKSAQEILEVPQVTAALEGK